MYLKFDSTKIILYYNITFLIKKSYQNDRMIRNNILIRTSIIATVLGKLSYF